MRLHRLFSGIASGFMGLSLIAAAIPFARAQEVVVTEYESVGFDPWEEVAASFKLTGRLISADGKAIEGARIEAGSGNQTRSNDNGIFTLPRHVGPDEYVAIRHANYAHRVFRAGAFFNKDGGRRVVELTRYTESFRVSPGGGIYTSGDLELVVPKGAVRRSVTVKAALLPLDFIQDDSGDVQPMRLGGVDLKPHGLTFDKPVTLTIPLAEPTTEQTGVPLTWDEEQKRFVEDQDGSIVIADGKATLTLTHFSPHGVGDASKGASTEDLGRGSDLDGDGEVTASDALFILLASGGTHEATANYSHTISGSVREEKGSSTSSTSSQSVSGEASGSFKGASFGVGGSMSRSKARETAKKFGKSKKWDITRSAEISVSVAEYDSDCQMIVGRYDFSRGYEWKKVELNETETSVLKGAYNARNRAAGQFHKFNYEGAEYIVAGRGLQGNHTIAAKKNSDGSFEVYVKVNGYIIAKPRGIETMECAMGTGNSLPDEAAKANQSAKGARDRRTALEKGFKFGESWKEPKGDQDWGMLGQDVIQSWINMECGNEQKQTWSFSFTNEEDEEESESEGKSSENSSSRTVGGFGMSVTASESSGKSSGKSSSSGKGSGTTVSNSISWHIVNAHGHHWSDHITAGLFKSTPNGIVPFGFAMVRIAERPCGAVPTPTPDPDGSTPNKPVPTGPSSSAPSGPSGPTEPDKKPQTSGGPADRGDDEPADVPEDEDVPEGEPTQEPGAAPDDRTREELDEDEAENPADEAVKSNLVEGGVELADLEGQTNVNPRRVGDDITVVVIGLDGKTIPVDGDDVRVETSADKITIHVKEGVKPKRIIVTGSKGTVVLRSAMLPLSPGGKPITRIQPSGSKLGSANGVVRESFGVPDGTLSMDGAPGGHEVIIGSTPVEPVAVRPNEIAVVGTGVSPPANGTTPVTITNPQGDTFVSDVDAWGYVLGAAPTTQVNVWAPIYFQCTGLPAKDVILITLTPTEGQDIDPREISISCGAASGLTVIAQYKTSRPGPQTFNARVRRVADEPG